MKIGLDIMGGDFAPKAAVLGAVLACKHLPADQQIVLIGDKQLALAVLREADFDPAHFEFVHTTEVINMGEHPTRAIAQKPDSSIAVGYKLLKEGYLQAFSSAGNSGAMLVGAVLSVKNIAGVLRPAIMATVPKLNGDSGIILDVGANSDCKPEYLPQFGILGSIFGQNIYNIDNPRVSLMNIGEEEEKGNLLCQAAYPLMRESGQFNFVGNSEGRDLFRDSADIFVCDGFTGNIILKLAESLYDAACSRNLNDEFFLRFNYEQYGGSPILGVNAPVVIGHGISSPEAIKSMIFLSRNMAASGLVDKIKLAFQ